MAMMLIGPLEAAFLRFLILSNQSRRVLEIGTFTGYSALAMAEVLPEDGRLITIDINAETVEVGKRFWKNSPHGQKIESQIGDAKQIVEDLQGPFDFVFIDADKEGYRHYFDQTLAKLSDGGIIALDNSFMGGGVLTSSPANSAVAAMQSFNAYIAERQDLTKVLTPIRDGILLVKKHTSQSSC